MFPTRILIIEDNEDNLALMQLLFNARARYEVLAATDGIKGLDIAIKERPEIILLDLAMPEMDGWEVARQLKTNILTKYIPIIAVTAHSLPKDRERTLEAGCDAFIAKPFSIAKLMSEIENLADW